MTERKTHWRLGFAGFGRVNRALAKLLHDRRDELVDRWGLSFDITLLSTATRGTLVDSHGLDAARCFTEGWNSDARLEDAIPGAPIDLLFEATPLDPLRGEPATTHVRLAIEQGISVVSANKGPVAFAAAELSRLARRTGAGFRFESAVADCLPVFDFYEAVVPVGRITAFRGVLNSTSNMVLQAVARGEALDAAVAVAQELGVAEADPAHDLDGWDQAVKAVIIANVLMGRSESPSSVDRVAVSEVDIDWLRSEEQVGRTVRLTAAGEATGPLRVGPVSLPRESSLAALVGGSLGIEFDTELAGTLTLGSVEPRVEQTAYGMLSDLVAIHQGRRLLPPPLPAGTP